jgi:hypothetical protein
LARQAEGTAVGRACVVLGGVVTTLLTSPSVRPGGLTHINFSNTVSRLVQSGLMLGFHLRSSFALKPLTEARMLSYVSSYSTRYRVHDSGRHSWAPTFSVVQFGQVLPALMTECVETPLTIAVESQLSPACTTYGELQVGVSVGVAYGLVLLTYLAGEVKA